jgi:hypothetical protein
MSRLDLRRGREPFRILPNRTRTSRLSPTVCVGDGWSAGTQRISHFDEALWTTAVPVGPGS